MQLPTPANHPTPRAIAQARAVTANPSAFADRPSLVRLAWLVTASAAGRTITQRDRDRVGRAQ